ncbi:MULTISPECIES: LysM peptidoglycan-binding and 3D domain-containing protein [unclassified Bacillus (in: firmicutes)]|uniref:LysM peptidoglycan-binding and 3D domain-containing protein n=1 Tax=unclassified Bacillus (in: firmicutes) TaxID=185979 RepID=UPI0008EEC045|nr:MULTISPECIES: 3D domain-containing protein [unclassified Bacillus (in: firmicutes)]SFA91144.1 3D (Asp-Asp-Asp) domain-containing protein [Bacillus sp. UNCCL13]SFQ85515.1 3D (Asp-Asp-Asp) domain-containing protein [Bacillus sp. cl95]
MKKTFKTMITALALSGTVAANVQAEEITIQKGDTLWGLSRDHQVSIEELKNWNQLSSDLIIAGDTLEVSPKALHTVKKGESLWKIAKQYNVTVYNIIQWNNLQTDVIQPNQILEIHEATKKVEAVKTQAPATAKPVQPAQQVAKPVAQPAQPVSTPAAQPAPSQPATTDTTKAAPTEAAKKEITVTATAYTASCEGCSGITATGINLKENPDMKVISVDPKVIPLGSKVYVEGYGNAIAGDTGGAIKGNKIDIFIPTKEAALEWGTRTVKVTILE